MSDTVVEKKGFGTRMKNSFSGIFGGIIIIIIGIVVLIFNERSNVINIHDVKELKDNYVDVKSDVVSKDHDGDLIVTSGNLDFGDEELTDSTFNVTVKTPLLTRKVEMYQWEEEKEETDKETRYTYKKVWSSETIDSSSFKEQSGHTNPGAMPYEQNTQTAANLKVGAYKLSSDFKSSLSAKNTYSELTGATLPEGYKVYNAYIMKSETPEEPKIGDVRISFEYASYSDVTVMGKLSGDTIGEYVTKENTKYTYFTEGTHDGATVIAGIEKGKKIFKWVLRLVGTILIIAGIKSIFGPLTTLSSYVPILGSLVNGATGLVSVFVGLAISLVVIAISWIVFRPILGICLLVGAVVLIILAKTLLSKKRKEQPAPVQPNNQV